jgi:hypothetical protein
MFRVLLLLILSGGAYWFGADAMGLPKPRASVMAAFDVVRAKLLTADAGSPTGSVAPGPGTPGSINDDARVAALALSESLVTEDAVEQSLRNSRGQIEAAITARNPTIDAHKFLDQVVLPEFRAHKAEFRALIADILVRHYTAAELIEWRAFADSPVGRKVTQLEPTLMVEARQAGEEWGRRLMQQSMAAHVAESRTVNVIH